METVYLKISELLMWKIICKIIKWLPIMWLSIALKVAI